MCGCEYCVTVDTGVPLDIAGHLARCHGWRDEIIKAIEVMETLEQPRVDAITREVVETPEELLETVPLLEDFTWQETEEHGWMFVDSRQTQLNTDQWVYLQDLKWVWIMVDLEDFLYSYKHGWLYNRLYQNTRIYYWYDRRRWFLPKEFNI